MLGRVLVFTICLQASRYGLVNSEKQQLRLSDSYLPVAMQVIAHLTDQMAFEAKDEIPPPKSTTSRPQDVTTPFHRPGLFAPPSPPKPSDRLVPKENYVLLPLENNSQYTLLEPEGKRTEEPLLSAHNDEVKPILEPKPEGPQFLPPYDASSPDFKISSRSEQIADKDEENLQYLSQNVRELIRMANDPDDDRVVDVWDGLRANPLEASPKSKLSSSNLRLLLLYDLLSRDAKKQRLSDFSGFSPEVMKVLVDSSGGGASAQLSLALSKMVERHDCGHDYANNRAKEMIVELGKNESVLSAQLRYLQPLIYKY